MDALFCTVGDEEFREHVQKEHMEQIIEQMSFLCLNHTIYMCAAEAGLIYVAIVYCPRRIVDICTHALKPNAEPLLS